MTERTKKALAAHFNVTPHAPLEEMAVGEEGKEKKPEGGVKHRWTDTEEHLLVKSVDKFLDEVTGRVNWDKVHNALTSKGFERSEREFLDVALRLRFFAPPSLTPLPHQVPSRPIWLA